jgi:hypothetical protein
MSGTIKKLDNDNLEHIDRGNAVYDRNILIDNDLARAIHARLLQYVPKEMMNGAEVNTHFRFSKYQDGGYFDIHQDGFNQTQSGKRSKYTLNIFLNTEFDGGQTEFYNDRKELVYQAVPKPGFGVLFDRAIWHRGNKVSKGYKYLLRTDICY